MSNTKVRIDAIKLLKSADNAKSRLSTAMASLEDAYDYVAPQRVNFDKESNSGDSKTADIWDSTAQVGVLSWANNVQSILMPPQKKWYSLGLSSLMQNAQSINDDEKTNVERKLQNYTDILFDNFNQSNVYSILNESFQDLCVSTGVIAINETTNRIPFSFKAISMSEITLEENGDGKVDRFYRDVKMAARAVVEKWKKIGVIPDYITKLMQKDEDEIVELLEGSIEFKENGETIYFYFVLDKKTKKYIYTEDKQYAPFIAFRMTKRPEDILGYGICQALLPIIKSVNLLSFYFLKSVKSAVLPIYLATKSGAFNPFTAMLEPGSIIPVNPGFASEPPIKALEHGGDLPLTSKVIESLQQQISEALIINPLGDVATTKNRSEGEMRMRQQNWAQQNAVGIGRLNSELIRPIITAALTILRLRGIIADIKMSAGILKVSDTTSSVSINFNSPLVGMQDQEDAQKLIQYMQMINEVTGPSGMSAAVEMPAIPEYIAKKLGIDLDLIHTKQQVQQVIQQTAQAMQQQQIEQEKAKTMASQGSGQAQDQQIPYLGGQ